MLNIMAFHSDRQPVYFLTMTELNYMMKKTVIWKTAMIRLETWQRDIRI